MTPETKSRAESFILNVKELKKHFYIPAGLLKKPKAVHAVDGIDLKIKKGEVLSLVGESGCGKSTTGRCVLRLLEPTSGSIEFENNNITSITQQELRGYRQRMQIIFQDPYASLNPRMTVGSILEEPLIIHGIGNKAERRERINSILKKDKLYPEKGRARKREYGEISPRVQRRAETEDRHCAGVDFEPGPDCCR